MYCTSCGKQIRDNSTFCSQCGKPQRDGAAPTKSTAVATIEAFLKNKKAVTATIAAIAIIAVLLTVLGSQGSQSIVGSWKNTTGNRNLTFKENGTFQWGSWYGKYEIYDSEIVMNFQDFDRLGQTTEIKQNKNAEQDGTGWYIVGKTLYFAGDTYERV